MKIRVVDIINSREVVTKIGQNTSYDAKTAYKLARNIKEISSELENFDKTRNNLIIKYGKENKEGNIEVEKKNTEVFNKELSDVLGVEVELNIVTIDPEKLEGTSPFELLVIDWMLKVEE